MDWKKMFRDYMLFSRRDRVGIIALFILIVVVYLLPKFFGNKKDGAALVETSILTRAEAALDSVELKQKKPKEYKDYPEPGYSTERRASPVLFRFDPNTLPAEGWIRLGLSPKTAATIDKYRSKGGKFYKPEDLQKIWGLPQGFYESVKGYIDLPKAPDKPFITPTEQVFRKEPRTYPVLDINEADSSAFEKLPGIGARLASRIVAFRKQLGGFYSVQQVAETYGLPDSSFQKIRPFLKLSGEVKKVNINTATKEEMKVHPYIRWKLANAIVEYRNQHGNFVSADGLKNIPVLDATVFEKLKHYIEF